MRMPDRVCQRSVSRARSIRLSAEGIEFESTVDKLFLYVT